MSTNDNTSTLKSYVDSATGYVQNAVGNIIGSTGDQVSRAYPTYPAASHESSQTNQTPP